MSEFLLFAVVSKKESHNCEVKPGEVTFISLLQNNVCNLDTQM